MNRSGRQGAPVAAVQDGALSLLIELFKDAPHLPRALCAGDPETWEGSDRVSREKAKRVCGYCPEKLGCAAYAAERKGLAGVWAGRYFRTKPERAEDD